MKLRLVEQLVECAMSNERTNIILLDNMIADAKGLSRMVTEAELQELNKQVITELQDVA